MLLQTLLFVLLAAGPLQQGPWVYGARENSVNILWISEILRKAQDGPIVPSRP